MASVAQRRLRTGTANLMIAKTTRSTTRPNRSPDRPVASIRSLGTAIQPAPA
jgi:hypothetical protein